MNIIVAASLMIEDPTLPPDVALIIASQGTPPRLPLVAPEELLRLFALGYRAEQL